MGFISGFFSGFALTTSVLYLTIQVHRANRLEQRNRIREQTQALNWLALPTGAYDRRLIPREIQQPEREEPSESRQHPMKDLLKHRWNEEVQVLAKKASESRWEDVRDTAGESWKLIVRLVKKE
ncbi:hypothetical protein FE257_010204 [Aspergillus nanangensis]|uniref:MICOS complex subunit MIC12 n=1 Tax=Aspergillus nanangensis TaxID=2582783 RepID=A0AAD4GSB9_ASPNN|nr:hypothetical protein FE257_010204 [Aspergillus nanangensis]